MKSVGKINATIKAITIEICLIVLALALASLLMKTSGKSAV